MASPSLLAAVALAAICSYFCYLTVARLLLSPLARFPGPKLAAWSNCYEFYYDVIRQGRFTEHIQALHRRYGGSFPVLFLVFVSSCLLCLSFFGPPLRTM